MAKEEKKAPKLRFNGYTNDWERKELNNILKINSGRDYKQLNSGSIPVYGTGGYMLSVNDKLSDTDAVGIGRKGTIDKPLYLKAPFWTVDTLFYCTSKESSDVKFIYLLFQIINWKRYDESTGVPSLSKNTISSIKTYVPKVKEQDHISKLFFSLDNTLQLHERKCEELTLIKKALLQKLFPKKDVIKPEVRYKNFNDAWEQRRFKDISKLSQGLQIAISKRFTHPGDGKLFYITNEFLNPNSTVKYYIDSPTKNVIAEKTDILMTRTGNTGKVVTDVEGVYHNNFFKISYNSSKIDRWFLYYLLNSYPIQREILVRAGNSTIPDLNHNDFYGIKIYIPTIEEQIKIGTFLTKVDSLIALHQYKLKKLKQLKKFLLQNMFI
ncbi:Type I restriction-modification system, specificity subunit S [Ligilactobacillus salivarius]|uniref:restriction endonuclease subunit S n=1 Tax=Ligilactobacillus salivarius TaxID=1624 RepID=UPI000BEEA306|nr:restriction endonuclease subunit S [Ligilactobacillus salivarius]PEH10379.1 restriction endonuclease subunit S [Lactobacillus sp. UMNPBX2]QIG36578.1 Type I restriction-modification system, specificity subunit S [Ligilactobacillus salivarius]